MTILRDCDVQQIECEECPTTTELYDDKDFDNMIEDAKAAGWRIMSVNGDEWTHTCPVCKRGNRLAKARRMFGS